MTTRKVVTRQGSSRQKWIPKGESQEALGEEEKIEEPNVISTRNDGPYYERASLLRVFAVTKESKNEKEGSLKLTVSERPEEEEDDGGKTPGTRRAMREQIKNEKLKKRGTADSLVEDEEEGMDMTHAMSGYGPMSPMMMAYLQSMSYAAANMQQMMYATSNNTTVMLRNIPNRYSRNMLIERLNQGYQGQFDFVYLPIDFNSKCNVGYAFINFRSPSVAAKFTAEFHGAKTTAKLPGFSSAKICEVSYARVQGRDANMDNLRDEKFIEKLNEKPEWQPLFFDENNKEIPFAETLGMALGKKGRGARAASGSTPMGAMSPGAGFMMGGMTPNAYGSMMYPSYPPMAPPGPPPTTLAGVLPGANAETMVMLKNVPSDWNREKMTKAFEEKYKGAFDFLFLPGDPKVDSVNRGYVFVNFRQAEKAKEFTAAYDQKNMSELFGVEASDKVCEVLPGRLESIERAIERLQSPTKNLRAKDKESEEKKDKTAWYPQLFSPDGGPTPFPLLTAPAANSGKGGSMPSAPPGGKDGKGKGKGKGKGADAAAAAMMGGYPMYPFGSPYAPYASAYAAAYQRAAIQHAHAHAAAAAAAHAGQSGMLDTMAAAMKGGPGRGYTTRPLNDDQKKSLAKQIEFYFSDDNLCKDVYLRSHMDAAGWTSLDLIANFNQVRKFRASVDSIIEALDGSTIVEVDVAMRRVRLKDETFRAKWIKASQELSMRIEASTPKTVKAPTAS